jgi:hypothetical protein
MSFLKFGNPKDSKEVLGWRIKEGKVFLLFDTGWKDAKVESEEHFDQLVEVLTIMNVDYVKNSDL